MLRCSLLVKVMIFGLLLFSFSSCFQYPEGPIFTMMTKDERLAGNWFIDQVISKEGQDITAAYAGQTLYVVSGRDSKSLSYFKINDAGDLSLYSFGTYEFADNSNDLIVIYTLYQGEDKTKNVLQIFFDIRKLTENWFYYIDNEGIEFHWKKN